MSGLPRALLQLLSSAVTLKCVKLLIVSEAPYIEGTSIQLITYISYMYSEKCRWIKPCYGRNATNDKLQYCIRSDGTLLMKVRGPNYRVQFVRQKEQTQYRWKENRKWILAVYKVQEFEIPNDEIEKWPIDEEVILPLKKSKTEIEVIYDTISLQYLEQYCI